VLIKFSASKKRKRNQRLKVEEEEKMKQKKNRLQIRDAYVETPKEGTRRRHSRKEYICTVVLGSLHYLSTLANDKNITIRRKRQTK